MVKVFIDAGHGGKDGGATGHGLKEKDITLKISKKIRSILNGYDGISTKMSRTGDSYPTLTQRTNEANSWGADLFLSIHINSGGGTGYEDYIYSQLSNSSSTAKIRDIIHNEIVDRVDMANRGKKKANFHVLRESKMTAILTENGFIDNKQDTDKMKSDKWINDVAQGHANGILKAFNIKGNKNKGNTNNTPKKVSDNVYLGNSIVDYLKSINVDHSKENRKKLAKEYNVSGYDFSAGKNSELLNAMRKGKPKKSSGGSTNDFTVGNMAKIKKSAKRFATGETIASHAKGKSYKIIQTKGNQVLLDSIMSWVYKKDLVGYKGSGSNKKKAKKKSYKTGDTVTLKKNAKRFATGETIANHAKGKKYKIIQTKSNQVLLDGIMSWVKKSDVK